jgi:flagellar motility protein MotE (MotC chaperone)
MIKLLMMVLMAILSFGIDKYDCNKIFDDRKSELIYELEKIDEQQQSLESLQAATNAMLNEKKEKLKIQEKEIQEQKAKIEQMLKEIDEKIDKNKKILADIKQTKDNKLIQSYAKMGAGKAALILAKLQTHEAANIVFYLDPKLIGSLLEKMQPDKAAKLTIMLQKGPPFLDFVNNHDIDTPESIKTIEDDF